MRASMATAEIMIMVSNAILSISDKPFACARMPGVLRKSGTRPEGVEHGPERAPDHATIVVLMIAASRHVSFGPSPRSANRHATATTYIAASRYSY